MQENERVVMRALESDIAKRRGWRVLLRKDQVSGMREWPVRGLPEACEGDEEIAEACIRSYKDDGQGVMGFFVAGFVRSGEQDDAAADDEGPYVRDDSGAIIRDMVGMPVLKSTGEPVSLTARDEKNDTKDDEGSSEEEESASESGSSEEDEWGGFED
jgi:putative methyltransferase